jgi:ABC-2 type transport system permease protein
MSLLGEDARRFWALTWMLAVTDWKLRFYGSALGYAWTLARPFAFFGVIYVVFTEIANVGAGIKDYGVCILFSLVLFQFFAEATTGSVTSVVQRENLLRKMRFPRLAIPLSTVVTALLNLGATLVAVFVFAIIAGVYPTWSWLELPLLIAVLAVAATGTGMLLAVLFVRYRDVQPIWDVVTMAAFYATPILYPLESVKFDWARELIMYNPLSVIAQQTRHAIFDPDAATAAGAIGGWGELMVPLGLVAATFVFGLWYFNKAAPDVAENV